MKLSKTTANLTTSMKQKNNSDGRFTVQPEYRFLIIVAIALLLSFIVSTFFVRITYVRGDSMEPTYSESNWLVSVPAAYAFSSPERGDVILMERPSLTSGYIIKRVIALPGETVEIRDGIIFIDGRAIEDQFSVFDDQNDFGPLYVEEDRYFLLGDNRLKSNDSRFWVEPTVDKTELRGKIIWRFPTDISDFFNSN